MTSKNIYSDILITTPTTITLGDRYLPSIPVRKSILA